ncbi:TetR/AcrR family transcriptional regulator [Gorillibacterium sp. CAU 1737]|uniref:TetR/AcrR family transcriptional regulator n=1 Tax=Gorillibacterium sp. CAU 1737 TaxID=3140362 RepID=UPI0032619843
MSKQETGQPTEERTPTRERIMEAALALFSRNGYEGVSVREIARSVGIKESSLYKHYQSKQHLFDTILVEMNERYRSMEGMLGLDLGGADSSSGDKASTFYAKLSEENLIQASEGLFRYFLQDEYAAKFRRMVTLEQYRNNEAGEAFRGIFLNGPLVYQSALFRRLMEMGILRDADPELVALHFYSPLYLLLCLYDNQPERVEEALRRVRAHVRQFNRMYSLEGEDR